MSVRSRLTETQIEDMKVYGELGMPYKDIAKEVGVCERTVYRYLGTNHVSAKTEQMNNLRSKGLSNSQIAKEIGVSYSTVLNHIGHQPDMNRAEYGSIVTHAAGSTFVKQPEERELLKPSKLKVAKASISCDGKDFSYKISTEGTVRISNALGFMADLTKDELYNFISELCEIGEWFTKNSHEDGHKFLTE